MFEDEEFDGEVDFDLAAAPVQALKPVVAEVAARARTRSVQSTRRDNAGTFEIDNRATRAAIWSWC